MGKLLVASIGLAALIAGPAMAADLPIKAPAYKAAPSCAQFGGYYVGGHIGWKYYNNDWKDKDNFGFLGPLNLTNTGSNTESANSWEAGVQAGYNMQWNCTVFGVQADWSWTNAKADNYYTAIASGGTGQSLSYSSRENWFGTLRTRTGLVINNLLLYVTSGLAWANFDRNLTYGDSLVAPNTQNFSSSSTRLGFVVGVGTEWAWTQNWSINSEVLYMGFEKDQQNFTCTNGNICAPPVRGVAWRYEFKDSQWVARMGVNYRFNSAVAANY